MDMGLSEIQQMLKNSAREFLAQECPLTLVRELEDDPQGFSEDLWRQVANLGWTGIPFPEQYGGTGGSFLDLAVLVEEMGRALLPAPFFATVVLGGLTVLDAGNDDQKRDILTGVCAGTVRLTLALTEPSATTEAWGVETQASASGDGYSINGTKLFVPDAHAADTMIVAARTMPAGDDPEQGITLFLVPSNAAGVEIEQVSTIGNERLCEVRLNNVYRGRRRRARLRGRGLAGHRTGPGPGHCGPLRADGGRRRGRGRHDRRVRQAAHPVRPAGGQFPGRAAPLLQHGHRR